MISPKGPTVATLKAIEDVLRRQAMPMTRYKIRQALGYRIGQPLLDEGREEKRLAKAKLKSLATFETRAWTNPLAAGDPVARDRWPGVRVRDYGDDIPNLFRFELAERWRGYYSLVVEPGGARVWILYLW